MSLSTSTSKEANVETLAKRYLHFLTSGEETDITLIVGKDKIPIKAHKLILMFGSSYFQQLLAKGIKGKQELLASNIGEVKELNTGSAGDYSSSLNQSTVTGTSTSTSSTDKQMDSLVIEDVEPDDFALFLQFLYSRRAPVDISTALPLLMCATKFNVPSLIEAAGSLLKQSLNLNSVLTIFQQAVNFKCQDLQAFALKLICRNGYKILESPKFPDLSEEAVGLILQKDELRAYDEMQVFEATIRWAHAECRRQQMDPTNGKYVRSVLELLLKFIRFPLMNASEFPMKVARLKILTTEERVDILEGFITPAAQRFSEFFRTVERLYFIPETPTLVVKVGGASTSLSGAVLNTQSNIKFKVNKAVWISKIGFCSWHAAQGLPISLTLKLKNANTSDIPTLEHKEEETFTASGSYNSVSVRLKRPVKIRAGTWYLITAYFNVQVQGQVSCQVYTQHTAGIRKVISNSKGNSICFEFESTGTNNNGQIAEIGYQLDE